MDFWCVYDTSQVPCIYDVHGQIWRCFFVWNRSIRVILVPLILVITEAGKLYVIWINRTSIKFLVFCEALFFVEIIFDGTDGELVSEALSITLNALLSAAFFITFATTLVTTILIAYRIYSVSKQEGMSARRFKHIIDIVIQSGAVNSLTLLANAIIVVLPASILNTKDSAANTYAENIVPYVLVRDHHPAYSLYQTSLRLSQAMSTTIMVARVALLSTETTFPSTVSAHLSGLQFHARSTRQSDTEPASDNAHPLDVHDLSDDEGKKLEGKVTVV
jgi:hypothetical protein